MPRKNVWELSQAEADMALAQALAANKSAIPKEIPVTPEMNMAQTGLPAEDWDVMANREYMMAQNPDIYSGITDIPPEMFSLPKPELDPALLAESGIGLKDGVPYQMPVPRRIQMPPMYVKGRVPGGSNSVLPGGMPSVGDVRARLAARRELTPDEEGVANDLAREILRSRERGR